MSCNGTIYRRSYGKTCKRARNLSWYSYCG